MKIYAPVKDFNGIRNGVRFVNGVAETTDSNVANWFNLHGYKVTTSPVRTDNSQFVDLNKIVEEIEPDFEQMSPMEIREWMKANGLGAKMKNIRNKDKLIEIIRG